MNRTTPLRRVAFKPRAPVYATRERKPLVLTPIRVPAPSVAVFCPQPKFEYVRSSALTFACSLLACKGCGIDDGTIVGAHSNWAIHGHGRGIKASDVFIASLCFTCHSALDQGDDDDNATKQRQWFDAHVATVVELQARGFWPDAVPVPDIENFPEQWT
jgi:hypothetical protein